MALNKEDLDEYTLKDFRTHLSQIVREVAHAKKRVRVTSYGKNVCYFVSEEELARLDAIEEAYDCETIENIFAQSVKPVSSKPLDTTPDKAWWEAQIQEGLNDIESGNIISGEEAYREIMAAITEQESYP